MPMLMKWVDAKAAGIPNRTWRKLIRRLRPAKGMGKKFLAAEVEQKLNLPTGTLQLAKRALR
jgi:hypothetical protein